MSIDYFVKNSGADMPWAGNAAEAYNIHIDIPKLIGRTGYFVDSSGVALTVPSTGFAVNDTIQFLLPKGLYIHGWGIQVFVKEGGACTCFAGVTGTTDLMFATGEVDLNALTTQEVNQGDEPGYVVLDATTYLVIDFDTAATAVAIFALHINGSQIPQDLI
jgi:hypothetical protein